MEPDPMRSINVLLVEDDLTSRTTLQGMLSKASLPVEEVACAESLSDALRLLAKRDFDIMLLDLNLPDSQGLDTLVRVNDKHPHIAVVVVTGEYGEELGPRAVAMGAEEYLVKGNYNLQSLERSVSYAIERKDVQRRLELAEDRYRTIFENSAVAITMVDERDRLVSWNKFTESLLGMDKTDLYLRPVKSLYPKAEWRKIRNYNVRQKGMQHHLETKMIKKDGQVIDIDISLSILKDIRGRTTGSIGVVRDVTDRKRIQEILNRKQKNLEAIFDAAPLGMLLTDEDLKVKRANDAITRMVHREYSQIIDKRIGSALGCVNDSESEQGCGFGLSCKECHLQKIVKEVFATEKPVHGVEVRSVIKFADEEIIPWLRISGESVMIDDSKYVLLVIDDITERKKVEEMKSQFVSTVSHELRTPLAAMKEGVAIVLDEVPGSLNDKQKKFLDIANRNAERLGALIDDILDFQKLGAGRMEMDMRSNNINDIITEVYEMMSISTEKNGRELLYDCVGDLGCVKCDHDKIIQVLTNLVGNAIKFTPEGGRVWIKAQRWEQELAVGIHDTGMGIPKEDLPKIFDHFYRVNRPKDEIQGTGLGLAIVKKIISLHSGRIEVESEPDEGAVFTVFLPLTSEPAKQDSPAQTDDVLESSLSESEFSSK